MVWAHEGMEDWIRVDDGEERAAEVVDVMEEEEEVDREQAAIVKQILRETNYRARCVLILKNLNALSRNDNGKGL